MKKVLFLSLLGLLTISAAACLIVGTAKKAVVTYSYPDYSAKKIVTKTAVVNEPVAGFTNMSALVLTSPNTDDAIASSPTSRISFSDGSLYTQFSGGIINADTTKEHLIKGTLTTNFGYVRVSGTGTFDPNTTTFTGDSSWIFWYNGSVQMSEVGNYASTSPTYKGVCTAKIIPAGATYYTVTGGVPDIPGVPVSAVITVPGFGVSNNAPQL